MYRKIKKIINYTKNDKGDSYVSAVIFLMIATFCLVFILQCVGAGILKINLDNECRQMLKVVQLTGQYTYETQTVEDSDGNTAEKKVIKGELADHFRADHTEAYCMYIDRIGNSETDNYHIDGTTDVIQIGDAFDVVCAEVYHIGFANLGTDVVIYAKRTGVSEKYWKSDEYISS